MTQMHDSKPTRGCLSAPRGGGHYVWHSSGKYQAREGDRKPPRRVRECAREASARPSPPRAHRPALRACPTLPSTPGHARLRRTRRTPVGPLLREI